MCFWVETIKAGLVSAFFVFEQSLLDLLFDDLRFTLWDLLFDDLQFTILGGSDWLLGCFVIYYLTIYNLLFFAVS